jgi:P-type conjugative transfer protein TrbJ
MREVRSDLFMGLGLLVVVLAASLCAQCSTPREAHAQLAVLDPTNLGQNTVTALNSVREVQNQVLQLERQLREIDLMYQNVKTLSVADRERVLSSFYQIQSLSSRAQVIGMQWERTIEDFDRVYGKTAAKKRRSEEQKRSQTQQTDQAYQDAMRSHAVIDKHAERDQQVQSLVNKSYDTEGTVQALQRAIEMLALLMHQLKEFEQVMLLDSRARSSDAMEQRRRAQAADEAASDRMKDWPTPKERRVNQRGTLPSLGTKGGR